MTSFLIFGIIIIDKERMAVIMKKRIILVLETENEDEINLTDKFIEMDLRQEINCASNYYEIVSITQEYV